MDDSELMSHCEEKCATCGGEVEDGETLDCHEDCEKECGMLAECVKNAAD